MDCPVANCQRIAPLSASNAYRVPPRSAANTRPPAVGVTPASIGRGAANFQRTAPVSASTAVSHPFAFAGGSMVWVAATNQPAPVGGTGADSGTSCTVLHQSAAPTYRVLSDGEYAAPFHSEPPR